MELDIYFLAMFAWHRKQNTLPYNLIKEQFKLQKLIINFELK
jgi:hypothetical protein